MKIALVHNWPGQRNSELELIKRITKIMESQGHQCILIDPLGHLLNSAGKHIIGSGLVNLRECEFCLNLHYVNPNIFDTFSYSVNWNPLDYLVRNPLDYSDLNKEHILYRTTCIQSHDAVLSAGSEEMDELVRALNIARKTCILDSNLCLHTTSNIQEGLDFPDFKKFKVFFISANWERQQKISRHGNLIELLDKTNLVDFYGVREQNGVPMWEGVRNYKGELPFDGGKSILEKSNKCGVTLVIHSEPHRKSGLVSTRIFQACAAKTLSICDNNTFIQENFDDSVLSFEYTSDSNENAYRIQELIEWIKEHPTKAREKAEKAHRIFKEKFSLEHEIENLLNSHSKTVSRYYGEFCTKEESVGVDVIFIYTDQEDSEESLLNFVEDLQAQMFVKTRAIIYARKEHHQKIGEIFQNKNHNRELVNISLLDIYGRPFSGHIVVHALKHHVKNPFFTFYSSRTKWHRLHLSQLIRAQEDTGKNISKSATMILDESFDRKTNDYYMILWNAINIFPRPITIDDVGGFSASKFTPSSILFRTEAFSNSDFLSALRFFDEGWAFFLVVCNYMETGDLPSFVPKYTDCMKYTGIDRVVDIYENAQQTESFEANMSHSFFKNIPKYYTIINLNKVKEEDLKSSGVGVNPLFSVHLYMQQALKNRPILLRLFNFFFRVGRSFLKLS